MLQYLNILLDDSSIPFCHYSPRKDKNLISLTTLEKGIRFAMMENLMIQFIYPSYPISQKHYHLIDSIDHFNFKNTCKDADVQVIEGWGIYDISQTVPIILRTTKLELFMNYKTIGSLTSQVKRLNIIITDIETFSPNDFNTYKMVLSEISKELLSLFLDGKNPQLNILTDRLSLSVMNNCGAGVTNITMAPNGVLYVCPAFYYDCPSDDIGDIERGIDMKNKHLYTINYAPICRHCDAWQCRRCIYLNQKTTCELNTPSHEQCVLAHIERNASRKLLSSLQKNGLFLDYNIKEINYLDPFEVREEWL